MKMYRCLFPNCGALLPRSGYCEKHAHYAPPPPQERWKNAKRSNENLYHSARWRKLQRATIERHPFCALCGGKDFLQVHHIKAPRGDELLFFDVTNLSVVCRECHNYITKQEIKERRK